VLGAIGVLIFVLGLLGSIALHEVGHMVPAKKFGVRVPQYMVGFGPTLWSRVRGETEYGIKAIPMGGYIRMIGMYPPRSAGRKASGRFSDMIEQAREESLVEIEANEEHRAFYNLSVPKKLTVMFGGPFMNLVLAFIFFALSMSVVGSFQPTTRVGSVVQCVPTASNQDGLVSTDGTCAGSARSAAATLGLQPNDSLVSVNKVAIRNWEDLSTALTGTGGKEVEVVYERNNISVVATVAMTVLTDPIVSRGPDQGFLGVSPALEIQREPLSAVPAVVWDQSRSAVSALAGFPASIAQLGANLFSDEPRDPNGPVGVIGVGRITGEISSSEDFSTTGKVGALLSLLAGLNVFLFIFNLLPLLPLDGGHMAGAIFEGLRRLWARIRGISPSPGPADTARMLPLTYVVAIFLIGTSIIVALADVIKPITLG
jgi:membrane-associated protease RseP (regulator of RpoE activity)